MERRRLGTTDLHLSVIGLGTWAIGGEWSYGWGPQDENESIATIIEALELGINWIDTAPAYGLGLSEERVGRALKLWSARAGVERPIIATKCGLVPREKGQVESVLTRQSIIKECEDSLRRLAVDCIDLYQIHWPKPAGQIGEAYQALLDLQKQGKIRWPGVSNFSKSQLEHIKKCGEVYSLQPPYSLINRGIEDHIQPYCVKAQIGMIVYSPLQTGLLTGKVSKEWIDALPASDWRRTKSDFFKEPKLSRTLSLLEAVSLSDELKGRPLSEIAIQWILARQGVTAAICGARKQGQIKDLITALSWKMTPQQVLLLDELFVRYFV